MPMSRPSDRPEAKGRYGAKDVVNVLSHVDSVPHWGLILTAYVFVLLAVTLFPAYAQDAAPLPDNLPRIDASNVAQLQRLAQIGSGQLYSIGLLDEGATLAVVVDGGIMRYDSANLTKTGFVPYVESESGGETPTGGEVPHGGASTLQAAYAGSTVAILYEGELWTLDTATGEQTREPVTPDYALPEPETISPDGQWQWRRDRDPDTLMRVTVLENLATGETVLLDGAGCGGQSVDPSVVFSADSTRVYTATGPVNGVVIMWDVATGAQLAMIGEFGASPYHLTSGPDTLFATRGDGNRGIICPDGANPGTGLYVTDLTAGGTEIIHFPLVFFGQPRKVATAQSTLIVIDDAHGLAWLENGRVVAETEVLSAEGERRHIYDVAVSQNGKYAATMTVDGVQVWDRRAVYQDEPLMVFTLLEPGWFDLVSFQASDFLFFDGTRLIYADFDVLHVVDVETGEELMAQAHGAPIVDLAQAAEQPELIAARISVSYLVAAIPSEQIDLLPNIPEDWEQVVLWHTDNSAPERRIVLDKGEPFDIGLSPDGVLMMMTALIDGNLKFFDTSNGMLLHEIDMPIYGIPPVFTPDGTLVAFINPHDKRVELWGVPVG